METEHARGLVTSIVDTFRRDNPGLSVEQLAQLGDLEVNLLGVVDEIYDDFESERYGAPRRSDTDPDRTR